jgi:hypothetical protein
MPVYLKARTGSATPQRGYVKVVNGPDHSEGIDAVAFKYAGPYLEGTNADPAGITLTWDPAPKAVKYEVYRNTSKSTTGRTLIGQVTDPGYADTDVTAGATYYYWVRAFDSADNRYWSNAAPGVMPHP